MVEFDKESNDSSNPHESNQIPSFAGEWPDAFQAFSTVPSDSRLVYLLFLVGLDSSIIAHALDLRYSEVEKRISDTKDILIRYAVSLVDSEIGDSEGTGNEISDREKSKFVNRLIDTVPQNYFEVYRRFRKNETVVQISQHLGIAESDVVRFERITRLTFLERLDQSIRSLTKIDAKSPPPFDQMRDLAERVREIKQTLSIAVESIDRTKTESTPKLSRDELLETEDLYYGLEAVYREVFELDAVGVDQIEIADILDIDPETARIRLVKARRTLAGQMERLIVSMILNRKKNPNAPRMKKRSYRAAKAMFQEIPENSRNVYILFKTTGYSHDEIGQKLDLDEEEIERRIKEARKVIRQRVLAAGILAVRKGEDIPTARKRILTRIRYVMALRKGQRQRQFHRVRRTIKSLDKLTDSEKFETGLLFENLTAEQQNAYALSKGLGVDTFETAEFLGCSESDIKTDIREVHTIFTDRLIQLIRGMLLSDSFDPDAPDLPESALETARTAWQFVGRQNEEVFRLYFMSGDSETEISETLGIDSAEVSDRIGNIRSMFAIRSEILLTSWLREKEYGDLIRAERILKAIPPRPPVPVPTKKIEPEESYDYNFFVNSELIEAKKSLQLLDYDVRETFILHLGAGLEKSKVAEIQKISVEEVDRRLLEAKETIRQRMEQMVLGMLRISWELSNPPQMKETEFEAAKATFEFVPQNCRKVYVRYRIHGESLEEIAEKLRMRTDHVNERLLDAGKVILSRALFFAVAACKKQDAGKPVAEDLLGDPKQIRFPADVWNKDYAEVPAGAVTETIQTIDSSPSETKQEKEKHRNPLITAWTFLGGLFTQLGAAGPKAETITLAGLWMALPTVAALFAVPFLWVLWLLVTEFIYGLILIRTAPTVQARQRLVKQLFYLYSSSYILPLALLIGHWSIGELTGYKIDGWIVFGICLICNITLFIRTLNHCSQWIDANSELRTLSDKTKPLSQILKWGFTIDTGILLVFLALIGVDILIPQLSKPNAARFVIIFFLVNGFIVIVHATAYLTFRYFFKISKDEAAFQKYKLLRPIRKTLWFRREFFEFMRFVPFAMWVILGNITHLIFVRLHVVGSLLEIATYSISWYGVWWINTKRLKSNFFRWCVILFVFGVLLAIQRWLRSDFYY